MPGAGWSAATPASATATSRTCRTAASPQIAERQGLRFLDLLPTIRQAQAGGARLYFPADGHWTSAGHAFAARQIADYLAGSGLAPRP